MNKLFKSIILTFLLVSTFSAVQAQDNNDTDSDEHDVNIVIPNFAILDIEPDATTSISLEADEPTEAGTALNFAGATNNELWLNYSSIVATNETRKVTVQLGAAPPSGLVLDVTAAAYAGSGGAGTTGTPTAKVTLTTSAQDIVTGIGSCYTGDGNTNGHQLTYELSADAANYGNITSEGGTVTVTYTIVSE